MSYGLYRTKKYRRTITKEGKTTTELCEFTEAQAAEGGAVLEPDGVNLLAAIRLCEKWNRLGSIGPIKYEYSIPFVKPQS